MTNTKTIEIEGIPVLVHNGEHFKGCKRCGGTGHYSFDGFDSLCYVCRNDPSGKLGAHLGTLEEATKWAHKLNLGRKAAARKREREFEAREEKMEAKRNKLKTEAPDVYEFLMGLEMEEFLPDGSDLNPNREKSQFLVDVRNSLNHHDSINKGFSEKMIAAVRKIMNQRLEEENRPKVHVEEGRIEVMGKIISIKNKESDFGTTVKVVVEDNRGFRVYGTLQKNLIDDFYDRWIAALDEDDFEERGLEDGWFPMAKGAVVKFVATVAASSDDVEFGWFSRPVKGEIVTVK